MYFISVKSLLNELWTIIDEEILEADNRRTILEEESLIKDAYIEEI